MRTVVDLPDPHVKLLDSMARKDGRSRAAVIREAVGAYVAERRDAPISNGFGLWGSRTIDGLEYQQAVRSEW